MMLIKKPKQQGAALIAVLLILVVVTLLGISAMRMGLTGLTVATNSQISSLLFQAADKGMSDMQNAIRNGGTNTADISIAMSAVGLVSALKGADVAYCVIPSTTATVSSGTNTVQGLKAGACDTAVDTNFLNARGITITQVNYQRRPAQDSDTNSGVTTVTGIGTASNPTPADILILTSTSVMPKLGAASLDTVQKCLSGTGSYMTSGMMSDDAADASVPTITDCLTDKGAVFTTHQDEFKIGFNF